MRALTAKIPWGDGQTVLREAMRLADPNASPLGQARAGPPDAGELGGIVAPNIRAAGSYGQIIPISRGIAAPYRTEIQPYTRWLPL
jgi:hypothetical protein